MSRNQREGKYAGYWKGHWRQSTQARFGWRARKPCKLTARREFIMQNGVSDGPSPK